MVDDIRERIVKPLEEANGYFEKWRYMTRLYTVISPNEMTRDPIFLENPDLPNVSNIHTATAKAICEGDSSNASQVIVTMADGKELLYEVPEDWAPPVLQGADENAPAAASVNRMYTAGPPEAVSEDEVPSVDAEFDTVQIGLLTQDPNRTYPNATRTRVSSGGCTSTGSTPVAGFAFMGLFICAAFAWRRRQS
jgi:hypothetical protein